MSGSGSVLIAGVLVSGDAQAVERASRAGQGGHAWNMRIMRRPAGVDAVSRAIGSRSSPGNRGVSPMRNCPVDPGLRAAGRGSANSRNLHGP